MSASQASRRFADSQHARLDAGSFSSVSADTLLIELDLLATLKLGKLVDEITGAGVTPVTRAATRDRHRTAALPSLSHLFLTSSISHSVAPTDAVGHCVTD